MAMKYLIRLKGKKYLILKYVNRKHSFLTRVSLGFSSSFFLLAITKSLSLTKLAFNDFFYDDFKLATRRLIKLSSIYLGLGLLKDETFNFCENIDINSLHTLNRLFERKILIDKENFTLKGQYLYVIAALIEADTKNKTNLINKFNNFSQQIIDQANLKFKSENYLSKEIVCPSCGEIFRVDTTLFKNSRRVGDFDIDDAIAALSEWNKLFSKEQYKWYIISGTFLGLIREGGFLAHDYDIDIGINSEDFLFDETLSKISGSKNFILKKIDILKEGCFKDDKYISYKEKKVVLLKIIHRSGLSIDLFIHYVDKDIIWHGSSYHRWENKIFDIETYNLHGVDVYGPKDSNLYLTENYGEWKTPVTDFHFNTGTPNLSIVKNPSSIAMFIKRISEFRSRKSFLKNQNILHKLNILSENGVFDIRGIQN